MKMRPRRIPAAFTDPLRPCNHSLQRCPVTAELAEKRIIIFRAGAFGDILMGTPLLSELRRAYPRAHVTWIAEYSESEAINANPFIDEVILWDSYAWRRLARKMRQPLWLYYAVRLARELRRKKFDIFISLEPERWEGLLYAINAPLTIGIFDTFWRFYGAPYKGRLTERYTHAYRHTDLPDHRIDQYLLALDGLGLPKNGASHQMTIGYTEQDRQKTDDFRKRHNLKAGAFVVIAPSTTWPTKCWPADRYIELVNRLARLGFPVVLTGAATEATAIDLVASGLDMQAIKMVGELSFRQLGALIADASLLVSGDTGPMHIAAAVNTPFVALFGPTAAKWYGPPSVRGIHLSRPVPCGPCDKKHCLNSAEDSAEDNHICMRLLSVDEVFAAAQSLIGVGELRLAQ